MLDLPHFYLVSWKHGMGRKISFLFLSMCPGKSSLHDCWITSGNTPNEQVGVGTINTSPGNVSQRIKSWAGQAMATWFRVQSLAVHCFSTSYCLIWGRVTVSIIASQRQIQTSKCRSSSQIPLSVLSENLIGIVGSIQPTWKLTKVTFVTWGPSQPSPELRDLCLFACLTD